MEPQARPWRQRQAARVVVVAQGRVLLFTDTDPGLPGTRWWITPGGGIDPGETPEQAAVRELREETGLRIGEDDLRDPVATRVVTHGYSDQVLVQREWFFRVEVPEIFTVDTSGFTELERLTMTDHAWFTAEEFWARDEHPVWPEQVWDLAHAYPARCLDLGEVEESTVPVSG